MRKSALACVVALTWLAASTAHAGVTDVLRSKLAHMRPDQPVTASVQLRGTDTPGQDKSKATHAHARFSLRAQAGQLHITYPAKLLQRLDAESAAHTKDSSKPQPIQRLLGNFGPLDARSLVNFAPALLRRLAGATLLKESQSTYDGKPARLLIFKVPSGIGPKHRDDLDDYQGQLKIWLGSDGVPVAVSEARTYQFSKFFIGFSLHASMAASLRRVGRRLVAVTWEHHHAQSGFGQDSTQIVHAVVDVRPAQSQVTTVADKP